MARRIAALICFLAVGCIIIFVMYNRGSNCPAQTAKQPEQNPPAASQPAKPDEPAKPAEPAKPEAAEPEPEEKPVVRQSQPGIIDMRNLRIDVKNRTISIDAAVCSSNYALEFLLCSGNEKGYESLLLTKAKPSEIHAALLMLGLMPGIHGTGINDSFVPPRGPEMTIVLRWKDSYGAPHEADPSEWLTCSDEKTELPKKWIFVGSEILPGGRYLADIESGIISVTNVIHSVIDVPFASTRDIEQRVFRPNPAAIPAIGTEVEIVLVPAPDAEQSPFARVTLEIGLTGKMMIDGSPITHTQLFEWGQKYIAKHSKGQVVIRANGLNPLEDIVAAKQVLSMAGVRDFSEQFSPAEGAVMPRNDAQLREMLGLWDQRFQNPGDSITPPADDAEWTLENINKRLTALEDQKQLWREYERQLRKLKEKYNQQ